MAILKVAQMGHPILRRVADPVDPAEIDTPDFQQFCDDLLDTMEDYDGAGLAAPQVHESIRVVVLVLSDERGPEFLINPEITVLGEDKRRTIEGCLSVDKLRGAVDRPNHVRVSALDRHGQTIGFELKGFPAVVVQHECDHLDGVLFVDRADPRTLAFLDQYRRWGLVGVDDDETEAYDEDEACDHELDDEFVVSPPDPSTGPMN